jgi:quercetin dioxygenase-like cupin family protein
VTETSEGSGTGDTALGVLDALPADSPYPGITRRSLDAKGASVVWYAFEPGAGFPLHRHSQEQITIVEAGSVSLRTADRTHHLEAGAWVVTAGGVDHGITAGDSGARISIVLVPRRAAGERVEVVE